METQTFLGWVGRITWEDTDNIPDFLKKAHDTLKTTSSVDEVVRYFKHILRVVFIPSNVRLYDDRITLPEDDVVGSNLQVYLHGFSERSVPELSIAAEFTFPVTTPFESTHELDCYQMADDYLSEALSFELNPEAVEVSGADAEYIMDSYWTVKDFELAEQPPKHTVPASSAWPSDQITLPPTNAEVTSPPPPPCSSVLTRRVPRPYGNVST